MLLAAASSLQPRHCRCFCTHALSNLRLRQTASFPRLRQLIKERKFIRQSVIFFFERWIMHPASYHFFMRFHKQSPYLFDFRQSFASKFKFF